MTAGPGTFVRSGKVRDLYDIGDDRLLLVASDRLSAFDVILPSTIADKGRVLTGVSRFWFDRTRDIVANHLLATDPGLVPAGVVPPPARADLRGRIMVCRRATVLPIEVVVRGYLAGSGLEGIPGGGRHLRSFAASGPSRVGPAPRAHPDPGDQGRRRRA